MFSIRSISLPWSLLLAMGCALAGHAGAAAESSDAQRVRSGDALAAQADRASDEDTPPPRVHDDVTDAHKRRRVGEMLHAESPLITTPVVTALSLLVASQATLSLPIQRAEDRSESGAGLSATRRRLRACRGRAPPPR